MRKGKAMRVPGSTLKRRGRGLTRTPLKRSTKAIRQVNPDAAVRRRKKYNARLHRADWKDLRQACFERDGFRCTAMVEHENTTIRCTWRDVSRKGDGLVADHLTYARFGRELLEDLRTLCKPCNSRLTVSERANWTGR